jgi:serine/threonine protein kinase
MDSEASTSQWFKKKGSKFGFWHKRYCTLSAGRLSVMKDDHSRDPERTISVGPATRIELQDQVKPPRFVVLPSDGRQVCLAHDSVDVIRQWVHLLRDLTLRTPNLSVSSFEMIRVIGRGFYGKVMLCKKIDDGQFYAVKTVHKARLVNSGKVHTIFNEKDVLLKAPHPFIVNLCFSF